jgi:uncharacterized phage protein (TIGR02218 family)
MTSFNDYEISRESSRPIELYQFTIGTDSYYYTSTADELVVDGLTFLPESISRNRVEQGADARNRNLVVTVPSDNAVAALYTDVVPGQRATLSIYRYQRDESPAFNTPVLLFKGIIQSVQFPEDGYTAQIAARSIESALNRSVPRFTFMGLCNHFVYDSSCGVDPTPFSHTGEVTAVTGSVITVAGAGASGLDFTGGYCRPSSAMDYRMVIAQSGDDLTLLLPFSGTVLGGNVQVFAGCNHAVDGDCALVFDNVANFGGFAFVPNRNVFQTGLDR